MWKIHNGNRLNIFLKIFNDYCMMLYFSRSQEKMARANEKIKLINKNSSYTNLLSV